MSRPFLPAPQQTDPASNAGLDLPCNIGGDLSPQQNAAAVGTTIVTVQKEKERKEVKEEEEEKTMDPKDVAGVLPRAAELSTSRVGETGPPPARVELTYRRQTTVLIRQLDRLLGGQTRRSCGRGMGRGGPRARNAVLRQLVEVVDRALCDDLVSEEGVGEWGKNKHNSAGPA